MDMANGWRLFLLFTIFETHNTPADLYLQGEKNKTKNIKTTY